MRQVDSEQVVADAICQALFHKQAAVEIPGLAWGNPGSCCGICYHLTINRADLPWLDRGVDIIGLCEKWGEYTSAHRVCPGRDEGEPDAK